MSSENRNVPDIRLPGEQANQNITGQYVRNNSDVTNFTRAQLASSDINRAPRRPSMTLEPSLRDSENLHPRSREVQRGVNRHSEVRRTSIPRRGSVQQILDNIQVNDRIVANNHLSRENGQIQRVVRNVEHSQRSAQEIGTLRDLPAESMVHRRREFQGVSSARTRGSNYDNLEDKDDRYIVPALPMPIAVLCCVLNFIIPGFGSMAASVCVFCCARTEDMTLGEKCGSCCTIFGIGVLQLLLVACFLIGWIWSCIWGLTFIGMSASYYDDFENNDDYTESNNPVYRGSGRARRSPLPTPQVVVDQPYPGVHYDDVQRARNRRREAQRRARSRISLTPSNVIYPMRAPSNIAYNSPPPPYQVTVSPPPAYVTDQSNTARPSHNNQTSDRHQDRRRQNTNSIQEEYR